MNYNDSEYQRSTGATSARAIHAWNAGATGRGVKVGVIDSGINASLSEFAGRIDPASRDLVSNRGLTDTEGHGTAVSGVIAAARDGAGSVGIAFESTIISLNSANPNKCDEEDGCSHFDSDIARGIDIAVANGARVINISLGGDDIGASMLAAVRRATAAGVVMVISAGNEELTTPSVFASSSARQSDGLVIIAGAHDANRAMASFSNQAGSDTSYYLTALGVRVRTIDQNGVATLWSGTSFSAPVISGAAALLAQAFPNLTGRQIVQLLLTTADDAGAVGVDSTFGRGILNIERAFQPQGTLTMAGSGAPVPAPTSGAASGTMGDASAVGAMAGAIILDGYSRAYVADLATRLSQAPQDRPLGRALGGDQRSATVQNKAMAVSLTIDRSRGNTPWVGFAQLGLTYEDARSARILSGLMVSRITRNTALAIGLSESGRTLQQRLIGSNTNPFLIARDPAVRMGFHGEGATSLGLRHDLGPIGLTVTAERGQVHSEGLYRAGANLPGYTIGALTLDRRIGPATMTLGATRLDERETILGGRLDATFGTGGAVSLFGDAAVSFDFGRGWGAYASYRRGRTTMGPGLLATGGRLSTDAWAFDVSKRGALRAGDMLALRVMQPLRVRSGGYDINLPVSYDYGDGSVGYESRLFNLAPTGREIDIEAGYGRAFWRGYLSANAFARRQPGHVAAAGDDLGGAIRFTLGF